MFCFNQRNHNNHVNIQKMKKKWQDKIFKNKTSKTKNGDEYIKRDAYITMVKMSTVYS